MIRCVSAAIALAVGVAASGPAAAGADLHLTRVVLVMRHGVRPPTHDPPLSKAIAPEAWPVWPVPPGYLTPHGAEALRLLGAYERQRLAAQDLIAAGRCPAVGEVSAYADLDERTEKSAAAFVAGFAPGCGIAVQHADGAFDPLFSARPDEGGAFDAAMARDAMLAVPPPDDTRLLAQMQHVLAPGARSLLALPTVISIRGPGRFPAYAGPLAIASSASEDFLLEYEEGLPMSDVGWGRLSAADVTDLLALHPRPPPSRSARPLSRASQPGR